MIYNARNGPLLTKLKIRSFFQRYKYWQVSYFSMKTYVIGTPSSEMPPWGTCNDSSQNIFSWRENETKKKWILSNLKLCLKTHVKSKMVQIRFCICAVWSGRIYSLMYYTKFIEYVRWTMEALIRLCICTVWSVPSLSIYGITALFICLHIKLNF